MNRYNSNNPMQIDDQILTYAQQHGVPIGDIIELAEKLISIPSVSGNIEKSVEILKFIETQMKDFPFRAFTSASIPSLLYYNKSKDISKFKLILNAHLDVVPTAKEEQFHPFIAEGKLFGRGAYDMKAAAAAKIILFKELAKTLPYPIALQLTTDEEVGGANGTAHQIQQGIRSDFVITAECGSNFRIVHEAKGMLHLKLIAKGKASHSAYPWNGDNAIIKLYEALDSIYQAYPLPKVEAYQTTINITHIQTSNSSKHTITPDHCEAILDVRYVPDEKEEIIQNIQKLLPPGITTEVVFHTPPHETSKDSKYIILLQNVGKFILGKEIELRRQHATSDARYFSNVNNDGVEFGPIGGNQHHNEEWVDIKSLIDYYRILKQFLLKVGEK